MKKIGFKGIQLISLALVSTLLVTGCGNTTSGNTASELDVSATAGAAASPAVSTSEIDLSFSARDLDVGYDETTATKITLSGADIQVAGEGVAVEGDTVTISQEGTYILAGTLNDGQIVVNAPDTDKIQLVLNGVNIHNEDNAAVYIKEADKVFITLASESDNTLSDGTNYVQSDEDNVDGVIFSKADLTINGSGSLQVNGTYKHGIVSKDDLIITGGEISVTSQGQGLYGKDCVKIKDGTFVINTQGDAVQSDNAENATKGFVYITGGNFTIDAQGDAFQAETLLQTDGGTFNIKTGGGSENASTDSKGNERNGWGKWGGPQDHSISTETVAEVETETETSSAKGLKAGSELIFNEGSFDIDASDDALHSNGNLVMTGGTYSISSGDDGLHSDKDLTITGGVLLIDKSYEGIEGSTITISGGIIDITSSDDGINVGGGNDSSSLDRQGQNSFSSTDSNLYLRISNGEITVNASGDGLDSNGDLYVEGGTITVSGPVNDGNGTLDYNGTATISGGVLKGTGSSGMAEGFSELSTQYSLLNNLTTMEGAGSIVTLTDSSGKVILSWTAEKEFNSVVLSSPDLVQGETYTLIAGNTSTEVTLSSIATSNGGSGMGGGRGGKMGGMNGMPPQEGVAPIKPN